MTMVARVADGLPLTASIQEDEQVCVFDLSKKILSNRCVELKYYCEINIKFILNHLTAWKEYC